MQQQRQERQQAERQHQQVQHQTKQIQHMNDSKPQMKELVSTKELRENQNLHNNPTNPPQTSQSQTNVTAGKKMMFSSSMLKMGVNNREGHGYEDQQSPINYTSSQNIPTANKVQRDDFTAGNRAQKDFGVGSKSSKGMTNNGVSSAGVLKRDSREQQFVSPGMRGGGSPTGQDKPLKIKTTTHLKANGSNFFGKDVGKTNKSPKGTDVNKKTFSKNPSEKAKDSKKPFNLQFNEYMNKQKNMNLNF